MPDVPFPYPGNKARLSDWIISHIPDHQCFVSVFGGAGGILFNTERSEIEVYNDKDKDLVHFFTILRDNPDDLIHWLQRFPYSRAEHEKWVKRFYDDDTSFTNYVQQYCEKYDAENEIVRAGIFFFLRYAQWGSKYGDNSGFAFSKVTNDAKSFTHARDRLDNFADRFDGVVIECLDWKDCMNNYDGEDTVFYLDPPYYKDTSDQHYQVTGFNHGEFVRYLDRTDANWILSYAEMPSGLEDYHIKSKESNFMIGNGKSGEAKEITENLIMNFNPESDASFHSKDQVSLNDLTEEDENGEFGDLSQSLDAMTTVKTSTEETEVNDDIENDDKFNEMFENEENDTSSKSSIVDELDGLASEKPNSNDKDIDESDDEMDIAKSLEQIS